MHVQVSLLMSSVYPDPQNKSIFTSLHSVSDYKKWYLEDGEPVLPPKTDEDVDLITEPQNGGERLVVDSALDSEDMLDDEPELDDPK